MALGMVQHDQGDSQKRVDPLTRPSLGRDFKLRIAKFILIFRKISISLHFIHFKRYFDVATLSV